jgi:hypothetical protein
MKIYLIKHKGKTWWGNLIICGTEITIGMGKEETKIMAEKYFFRKKDAEIFRKTLSYWDNLEVVSAEVKKL